MHDNSNSIMLGSICSSYCLILFVLNKEILQSVYFLNLPEVCELLFLHVTSVQSEKERVLFLFFLCLYQTIPCP